MPSRATRINQQNGTLQAGDMSGAFSSYEVKFTDTTKPNGQIWAGVIGARHATERAARPAQPAVVRGVAGNREGSRRPNAAKTLAQIRPYAAPPPPAPDPNARRPRSRSGGRVPVGVPVPVGRRCRRWRHNRRAESRTGLAFGDRGRFGAPIVIPARYTGGWRSSSQAGRR